MPRPDHAMDLQRLRVRRQALAGQVRQVIDDLTRTAVQVRHQPDKDHELELLSEALAVLGRPSLAIVYERSFHQQVAAFRESLELME